ncbi:MAG: hypothetical protein ACO1SX_18300 [Actinomycetota bacterium]
MPEEHRPLLLLVSEQEPGLQAVRAHLREAGYLVASSRSAAAAISLLDQVRVDGCVLMGRVSVLEANRLAQTLERYTPRCPKVYLTEPDLFPPDGWDHSQYDQLLLSLSRVFAAR